MMHNTSITNIEQRGNVDRAKFFVLKYILHSDLISYKKHPYNVDTLGYINKITPNNFQTQFVIHMHGGGKSE